MTVSSSVVLYPPSSSDEMSSQCNSHFLPHLSAVKTPKKPTKSSSNSHARYYPPHDKGKERLTAPILFPHVCGLSFDEREGNSSEKISEGAVFPSSSGGCLVDSSEERETGTHSGTEKCSETGASTYSGRDATESAFDADDEKLEGDSVCFSNEKRGGFERPETLGVTELQRSESDLLGGSSNSSGKSVKPKDQFYRVKYCPFYKLGTCRKGDDCTYAHNSFQLQSPVNLTKTKLCQAWMKGYCDKEADCSYAHGEEQLRATPDYFKTKLCKFWVANGNCSSGDKCRHAHGVQEMKKRNYRQTELEKQARSAGVNVKDFLKALKQIKDGGSSPESENASEFLSLLTSSCLQKAPSGWSQADRLHTRPRFLSLNSTSFPEMTAIPHRVSHPPLNSVERHPPTTTSTAVATSSWCTPSHISASPSFSAVCARERSGSDGDRTTRNALQHLLRTSGVHNSLPEPPTSYDATIPSSSIVTRLPRMEMISTQQNEEAYYHQTHPLQHTPDPFLGSYAPHSMGGVLNESGVSPTYSNRLFSKDDWGPSCLQASLAEKAASSDKVLYSSSTGEVSQSIFSSSVEGEAFSMFFPYPQSPADASLMRQPAALSSVDFFAPPRIFMAAAPPLGMGGVAGVSQTGGVGEVTQMASVTHMKGVNHLQRMKETEIPTSYMLPILPPPTTTGYEMVMNLQASGDTVQFYEDSNHGFVTNKFASPHGKVALLGPSELHYGWQMLPSTISPLLQWYPPGQLGAQPLSYGSEGMYQRIADSPDEDSFGAAAVKPENLTVFPCFYSIGNADEGLLSLPRYGVGNLSYEEEPQKSTDCGATTKDVDKEEDTDNTSTIALSGSRCSHITEDAKAENASCEAASNATMNSPSHSNLNKEPLGHVQAASSICALEPQATFPSMDSSGGFLHSGYEQPIFMIPNNNGLMQPHVMVYIPSYLSSIAASL